jgi:hypothetical protein
MSDIVAQVFSQPWDDQDDNEGVPEVYINTGNGYMNIDTFVMAYIQHQRWFAGLFIRC